MSQLNNSPVNIDPTWSQEDVVAFRDFLSKHRGFIDYLFTRKPMPDGDTIEKAALNAKLRDGFDKAMEELKGMAADKQNIAAGGEFLDTARDS